MNLRNLSVAGRLALAIGAVIAIFGAAITLSILRLSSLNDAGNLLANERLARLVLVDDWVNELNKSMRATRNMLLMDEKSKIQEQLDKVHETLEARVRLLDQLKATVHGADEEALLREVEAARAANIPNETAFLKQVENGELKEARTTLLERARPTQLAMMAALEKMADYERRQAKAQAELMAASYRESRSLLLVICLVALAVAAALGYLLIRAIRNPLAQAVRVLAEIGRGNLDNVIRAESSDETGQVLRALDAMQASLKERTIREREAATENVRIRQALDRVSAGTMLADVDGKIIYANDASLAMLRAQVAEIRKQLPHFDPERVLGSSFDTFHRVPSHQRNVLAGLTGTHRTDMRLGGASLRIVANPVLDQDGKRLGTVVEWFDRTQEVATEEEVERTIALALDGDLTSRVSEAGKTGFFANLSKGVNRLVDNTADIIRTLSGSAAQVRVAAEEISRGNADLSQRTEEQASNLEETASSMEEMTSSVKTTAENASQARQLAIAAREQADSGRSVVESAITAMSAINGSSKKISDIISVIDEIAFQTNLLALNAAVEAARAGEQGRGFAVVATEVRNLAGRSATAAKEIKALINDSVGKVEEGSKLVNQSGNSLGEISLAVKKVADVVAEMAAATQEQASGIEQVNRAVMSMDEVTQQNAALVEQAAAASQAIVEQAKDLTDVVGKYQIGESSLPVSAPRSDAKPPARGMSPAERRSAARPWTKKAASPGAKNAPAPAARTAAGGAGEADWQEF
ncbi:MAG: MCP four helix bundle domain-containing protein [Proteobacteria bacterium]|nr:MCP four helix bundle domain-containing protein [Pseudomonadota bacterium]